MDFYLQQHNCTQRLIDEWVKYHGLIIALDFDNTIFDYHSDGQTFDQIISLIKECKKYGCKVVIFAAREEEDYDFIRNHCKSIGIDIDGINENMPYLPYKTRKIYYNVLLDDRAGLKSAFESLSVALYYIKEKIRK